MSNFYYDKRATYSLSGFHSHELQDILAIFLLKPALYAEHKLQKDKQGYFFAKFRAFAEDYYHFDSSKELDTCIYFMSVLKERAGEANVCGGTGRISNSAKKEFKSRHNNIEAQRGEMIDYFLAKYRVGLATGKDSVKSDERLFLGVTEIWNKLDQAAEIVASSRWSDVLSRSYDDAGLTQTIHPNTEKHLIPHAIRNRVWQKLLNSKRTTVNVFRRMEPIEPMDLEEEEPVSVPPIPMLASKVLFVLPKEMEDDDW